MVHDDARRERTHDLVLFGATGFTGRLVAEELAKRDLALGLRWAIAGRDRDRLERIRTAIGRPDLPILIGDVRDEASLEAIARDARVVCSTVGPYTKYGDPVVAACVRAGTDYCDLTGEVQWVRRMIDAHHAEATRTGARIVHACGFDSIPSDLGVHLLQTHAKATHGAFCSTIVLGLAKARGGLSGGTAASAIEVFEEASRDRSVRRLLVDPYGLDPDPGLGGRGRGGPDRDRTTVAWDPLLEAWTAPFVMALMNTRVVRRTHALLGRPYGRDFRYREVVQTRRGLRGLAVATVATAALGGITAAASFGPTRALLARAILPKPGEGPSAEKRERGCFVFRAVGEGIGADGRPFRVEGRIEGKQDPGYGETAKMLSAAAICLAIDGPSLRSPGGIHTPVSAMGDALLRRVREVGTIFEIVEPPARYRPSGLAEQSARVS
jgi:short subunit dehydrogenase-like uncharacterized protein